jgi:hypothetical protein
MREVSSREVEAATVPSAANNRPLAKLELLARCYENLQGLIAAQAA